MNEEQQSGPTTQYYQIPKIENYVKIQKEQSVPNPPRHRRRGDLLRTRRQAVCPQTHDRENNPQSAVNQAAENPHDLRQHAAPLQAYALTYQIDTVLRTRPRAYHLQRLHLRQQRTQ